MNKKMTKEDRKQRDENIIVMIMKGYKQRIIAEEVDLTEFHICRIKKKYEEKVKNKELKYSEHTKEFWKDIVNIFAKRYLKENKNNVSDLQNFLGFNDAEFNSFCTTKLYKNTFLK